MATAEKKQAFKEAIKEIARVAVLGAVSAVISYLTTEIGQLDPNSVYAVLGTIILRGADKYIHEDASTPAKGLVPF